jgi:hypothetical protein
LVGVEFQQMLFLHILKPSLFLHFGNLGKVILTDFFFFSVLRIEPRASFYDLTHTFSPWFLKIESTLQSLAQDVFTIFINSWIWCINGLLITSHMCFMRNTDFYWCILHYLFQLLIAELLWSQK